MLLFSPYARINQVPLDLIFEVIRYLLFRWGFIRCFRTDNGAPFGEPSRQALSPLHLRLCASGMSILLNPPRSPKRNAKVERSIGTTSRWADPSKCANYIELQIRLNEEVEVQRELLTTRVCKGKTRAEYYPQLFSNPLRFNGECFDIQRVYDLLAKGSWKRKISAEGSTDLFGKSYQVGRRFRNQTVEVRFDSKKVSWLFKAKNGDLLREIAAQNLSENNIRILSYCQ